MTREEREDAVERLNALKQLIGYDKDSEIVKATQKSLDMAIKALEQEPIFDKVRAEIEKLQKMCDKNDLNLMAQYSAFGMVLDILDKYKAETPQEPKTGHWIESDAVLVMGNLEKDNFLSVPAKECSVCHKPHIRAYGMDYCPNCGAKMAESEDT